MLKFNEKKTLDAINGALALRKDIEKVVDQVCKEGYDALYFLGIGGTWASGLQAECYLLENSSVPVFVLNAAELVAGTNRRINEKSLVVFSTVTGSTKEIVESVAYVKSRKAKILGFIDNPKVPLVKEVDYVITYPENEQLKFFMLAHRFMFNRGEFPEYEDYYANMDKYLAKALVQVEKDADEFALNFALDHCEDDLHYFVGAGSQWGSTYSYAMCYWEEQHWIRTKSIHSAEFFHGMFEVVDKYTNVTVFMGEDKQRVLTERVAKFLPRICGNYTIIDTKDFKLEGIKEEYRGSISHLVIHAVTKRIDIHIESINCHPLEIRRYYRQLDY